MSHWETSYSPSPGLCVQRCNGDIKGLAIFVLRPRVVKMMRGLPKRRRCFGGLFTTPPPMRLKTGRLGPPRKNNQEDLGFLSGLRRFDVRASRVRVLGGGPSDFYVELLSRCRRARSRVSLSAVEEQAEAAALCLHPGLRLRE
jgi:hypothetical protein